MRRVGSGVGGLACLLLAACMPAARGPAVHPARAAAAVGEVTATSAVVWARCAGATHAALQLGDGAPTVVEVGAERDFTARIPVGSLASRARHDYRVWCDADVEHAIDGTFRTAPGAAEAAPVRLAWGGDVGGQNVCRDAVVGYDVFDQLRARDPDFFVALGDMIYADDACLALGRYGNRQIPGPPPAEGSVEAFRRHWRYNREDPALARFLLATSYYGVWDDHETNNDAGPQDDVLPAAPGEHRLPLARAAFLDYQPLVETERLYRQVRWGRHLEVFILDTRSHRESARTRDAGPVPKSMLGAAQRRWLIASLAASEATWKVVVSSVPMAIPTGGDGWADVGSGVGFERELLAILASARAARVRNLVWLTTDVHFATGFRHRPFKDCEVLELVSGPLNAGILPQRHLDPTLRSKRLFFHDLPTARDSSRFADAHAYFNFGELEIDGAGGLTARIIDATGRIVFADRYRPR